MADSDHEVSEALLDIAEKLLPKLNTSDSKKMD